SSAGASSRDVRSTPATTPPSTCSRARASRCAPASTRRSGSSTSAASAGRRWRTSTPSPCGSPGASIASGSSASRASPRPRWTAPPRPPSAPRELLGQELGERLRELGGLLDRAALREQRLRVEQADVLVDRRLVPFELLLQREHERVAGVELEDALGLGEVALLRAEDPLEVWWEPRGRQHQAGGGVHEPLRPADLAHLGLEHLLDASLEPLERGLLRLVAEVEVRLHGAHELLAFELVEAIHREGVDRVDEEQDLVPFLLQGLEVRAVLDEPTVRAEHEVDVLLPLLHAAHVLGERGEALGRGALEPDELGETLAMLGREVQALLQHGAVGPPELRVGLLSGELLDHVEAALDHLLGDGPDDL